MKRGDLIHFKCYVAGKPVGAEWRAIYHGDGKAHTVGRRKHGPFVLGEQMPEDRIEKIRFGWRIVRQLP